MSDSEQKEFNEFLQGYGFNPESTAMFDGLTQYVTMRQEYNDIPDKVTVFDILYAIFCTEKLSEKVDAIQKQQEQPQTRADAVAAPTATATIAAPTLPQTNGQSYNQAQDSRPPEVYTLLHPQSDPNPAKLKPEIIKGFLREGYRLEIVGTLKGGKSTFLEEIGTMASRGLSTLGFEFPRPLNILYIDPEMQPEEYKARGDFMRDKLLADQPDEIKYDRVNGHSNFHYLPMKKNRPGLHRLVSNLIETARVTGEKFDVVILDSIYKFFPGNENDQESWTLCINEMDRLQDSLDCSLWYSHHTTKGDQNEKETIDLGSGSNYQGRDYDAFIAILPLIITGKQKAAYGLDNADAYELSFVSRYFPRRAPFRILARDCVMERTEETDRQLAGCLHSKKEYNQQESAQQQHYNSITQKQERLDVITGAFEKAGTNMLTKNAIIDAMKKSVAFEGCKSDSTLDNEYNRIMADYDGKLFIRHSGKKPISVEYLGGGNNA